MIIKYYSHTILHILNNFITVQESLSKFKSKNGNLNMIFFYVIGKNAIPDGDMKYSAQQS